MTRRDLEALAFALLLGALVCLARWAGQTARGELQDRPVEPVGQCGGR